MGMTLEAHLTGNWRLDRISSSSGSILHLGLGHHAVTHVAPEIFRRTKIRFPADQVREFTLHSHEFEQSKSILRLKFNKHIDVAVRAKIISQH